MTLGILDVSVGAYERALEDLRPLIANFDRLCCMEIIKAGFVPDAVEALVAVGRPDEAEPMVAALERDGRRLHRTWMLAIGARCRGMMLAARGDVQAAESAVRTALAEHARLRCRSNERALCCSLASCSAGNGKSKSLQRLWARRCRCSRSWAHRYGRNA